MKVFWRKSLPFVHFFKGRFILRARLLTRDVLSNYPSCFQAPVLPGTTWSPKNSPLQGSETASRSFCALVAISHTTSVRIARRKRRSNNEILLRTRCVQVFYPHFRYGPTCSRYQRQRE